MKLICGIDEVGRGPLAGPVVSACVIIKPESAQLSQWNDITDSKKLSLKKRESLFDFICENSFWAIGEANVAEIDRLNIHHATLLAMARAYENMMLAPDTKNTPTNDIDHNHIKALVDGKFAPDLPCETETMVKGDSKSIEIGAASILAKVTRDRMMIKMHAQYPYYAWDNNAGYGTKAHKDGLAQYGLTPYHRLSFAPCAALIEKAAA